MKAVGIDFLEAVAAVAGHIDLADRMVVPEVMAMMSVAGYDVVRHEIPTECIGRIVLVRLLVVDGYHNIAFGGKLRFDGVLATETAVGGIEDIHADEVEFRIREDGDGVVRSPKNVDDVDYRYSKFDLEKGDIHRRNY